MCGRYTYYNSKEIVAEYKLVPKLNPQATLKLNDNYNVAPSQTMPVIVRGEQEHTVELMEWGLIPVWSKPGGTPLKLINARQEGLTEKPMWKRLVKAHRCVVPARGFYEWKQDNGGKQPYYITPAKGEVLSFAGLWDEWTNPAGDKIKTYTIITTSPNKEMAEIHDRMPAILDDEKMKLWLSPGEIDEDLLHELLHSAPDGTLSLVRVSKEVNNIRNNSEKLIYPLED
ncbi:MAG: SOS response-associated peptidase [bacterium]|nr:SOS response-associated peptidase [bacterium]